MGFWCPYFAPTVPVVLTLHFNTQIITKLLMHLSNEIYFLQDLPAWVPKVPKSCRCDQEKLDLLGWQSNNLVTACLSYTLPMENALENYSSASV